MLRWVHPGCVEDLDLKPRGSREKQIAVLLEKSEARGDRSQQNVTEAQVGAFPGHYPQARRSGGRLTSVHFWELVLEDRPEEPP